MPLARPRSIAVLAALSAVALVPPAAPAYRLAASSADRSAAAEPSSPAAVTGADGRVDLFFRGSGGELRHQWRLPGGSWTVAQNLGGVIVSQPAVVSPTDGRYDVFARGGGGLLVHKWYSQGRWSGWEHLATGLASAPSVASWAAGRYDVFARGASGALLHKWYVQGRWSGWQSLGGILTSAPAATSWAPGRLDVFVRATDGSLRHTWYAGGRWARFEDLHGVLYSQPAAISAGAGSLDVFVRGGDDGLRRLAYRRSTGWVGYTNLRGTLLSGPGATVTPDGLPQVYVRGSSGYYATRTMQVDGSWTPWVSVDALRPFRGLGAWVDLYDYDASGSTLDAGSTLDDLHSHGVRTLYLQTARYSSTTDMSANAGSWLDAAHARGLQVVGWYIPDYTDMNRDVRRSLAIANYVSPSGQRFDGVGIDIEVKDAVGLDAFNTRSVDHMRAVRNGTSLPLAEITPPPTSTDNSGDYWYGFPWSSIGRYGDVVMPMAYWAESCTGPCVYDYTETNTVDARNWSGLPVHTVGRGYPANDGTKVTDTDIHNFVNALINNHATGGSIYDYASTRTQTGFWTYLAWLNTL